MLLPIREQDLLHVAKEEGEKAHRSTPIPALVAPIGLEAAPCRIGTIELDAADTVVLESAKVEIALVLAHRGQGRMRDARWIPEGFEHFALLRELHDTTVIEARD